MFKLVSLISTFASDIFCSTGDQVVPIISCNKVYLAFTDTVINI